VAGLFNWGDRPADVACALTSLGLDARDEYWVSDFWDGKHWKQKGADPLIFKAVPPHGAHLVALRRTRPGPALVASSFHFSQGKEITAWQVSEGGLDLTLALGRVAEGELRLTLPSAPHAVTVDGRAVAARVAEQGVYALAFAVKGTAVVHVAWGGGSG